jgi:hypothetical protein
VVGGAVVIVAVLPVTVPAAVGGAIVAGVTYLIEVF